MTLQSNLNRKSALKDLSKFHECVLLTNSAQSIVSSSISLFTTEKLLTKIRNQHSKWYMHI